ncbi:MAG: hypothetical protein HFE39_01595 [Clostridiales bacterium]|nr:hypothetical protein [Clostridiales bacterium]
MKDSNIVVLQFRMKEETHKKLKQISNKELRSLNNQIEYFVVKGIQEYERQNGPLGEEEQ